MNKTKRNQCYEEVKKAEEDRKAKSAAHRGYLSRTNCLVKYLFDKEKRDECNEKAKGQEGQGKEVVVSRRLKGEKQMLHFHF